MLEEQTRLRNRLFEMKAERDNIDIHIAELENRLLAYDLAEGRGNL